MDFPGQVETLAFNFPPSYFFRTGYFVVNSTKILLGCINANALPQNEDDISNSRQLFLDVIFKRDIWNRHRDNQVLLGYNRFAINLKSLLLYVGSTFRHRP